MKITFILRGIKLSGGVKGVFEFANHLEKRGHKVSVIYPLIPLRSGVKLYDFKKIGRGISSIIKDLKSKESIDWFNLKADLKRVPFLYGAWIPDADIIIATWWETAYYVKKFSQQKGEKFYLVQHYETWGGPKNKVDNSYRLGLRIIVHSTWLKDLLEQNLNVETEALIPHAPDWQEFFPEDRKKDNSTIRILIPYRKEKWKGSEDGIRAFEITKEKFPNIKLVMFGPEWERGVPSFCEFHLRPSNAQLRKIYNSCEIFVSPSWTEGFGTPPLEAMACKCAVVTTNVGAVPDYTIPGKTAMVSEPKNIKELAQNIIELIRDEKRRKAIAENGHNYIKQFTWERATIQLEEVFKKYHNKKL